MNPISPTPAGEDKTPTPMTDAQECTSSRYDGEEIPGFDYVPSSFARSLERRISALEGALKVDGKIEAGDEQARGEWEDGEGSECVTTSGIWHAALAYERSRIALALSAASQPSAMKGGQEFRHEYQVQWVDHPWSPGDLCEYQIRRGRWIRCKIVGRKSDEPARYAVKYFNDMGIEKTGSAYSSDIRPLPSSP